MMVKKQFVKASTWTQIFGSKNDGPLDRRFYHRGSDGMISVASRHWILRIPASSIRADIGKLLKGTEGTLVMREFDSDHCPDMEAVRINADLFKRELTPFVRVSRRRPHLDGPGEVMNETALMLGADGALSGFDQNYITMILSIYPEVEFRGEADRVDRAVELYDGGEYVGMLMPQRAPESIFEEIRELSHARKV